MRWILQAERFVNKMEISTHRDPSKLYSLGPSGKLVYSEDSKGNHLPDFSHVGYHSVEKAIPHIPVKTTLESSQGDDTQRIQNALDELGDFPLDKDGFRGALLLRRGVYRVEGTLTISNSGIVLRGEGNGPDDTCIIATGYDDQKYQRALISVDPQSDNLEAHIRHGYPTDQIKLVTNSKQVIVNDYVPVGSHSFEVKSASGYKVGDRIVVYRPSTAEWIHAIGCDQLEPNWSEICNVRWVKDGEASGFYYQRLNSHSKYCLLQKSDEAWDDFVKRVPLSEDGKTFNLTRQWEVGDYDFHFERRITGIDGNHITINAPIVHSMAQEYGGGAIYHYETGERVLEVGVENMRLVSEFAAPIPDHPYGNPEEESESENHAWHGVELKSNTENTWVRDVTGNYFGWSLVSASGKHATVQDCVSFGHASKITGGRRYTFMIDGQLNLVQRCIAYNGRHEFVTQEKTAGPNVFADCIGFDTKAAAGPHHRYSVGTLFDNVKSERGMESRFRGKSGTGHGWAGTQTCFYNCVAPGFDVEAPPGGMCWVIGSEKKDEEDTRVTPASLYYQQVQDRLGEAALDRLVTEVQRKYMGEYRWVKERLMNESETMFVPSDFEIPLVLETERFRLRMLSVDDVEKDYEAVIESRDLLRARGGDWPRDGFKLEENLADLERHQQEFLHREAFAYTVVSLDESRVLGCLYINPAQKSDADAEVYMWARKSEQSLDPVLFLTVKRWIEESWPFDSVAYPGRE